MTEANRAFWLLGGILFAALMLPKLLSEGVFFDGLFYASISRNLAEGFGDYWSPRFSDTFFPIFAEHPPLQIWLGSFAFRLFGDDIHVEKAYSLATFVATSAAMLLIWRRATRDVHELRQLGWLPLVLFLTIPSIRWAFVNNMLENTLSVLTTFAVYFVLVWADPEGRAWSPRRLLCLATAATAIAAAVMTKGPVGLFPLISPGCIWLAGQKLRLLDAILAMFVLSAVTAALLALILATPAAQAYADLYVSNQVMASLSGARGSDGGGWSAIYKLAIAMIIPLLVATGSYAAVRRWFSGARRFPQTTALSRGNALLSLLIALSASLPIFLSPRVNGFYFNQSLPFYALAFAFFGAPSVAVLLRSIPSRALARMSSGFAVALVATVVAASFMFGRIGRDRDTLHDTKLIGAYLCAKSGKCTAADRGAIQVCHELWSNAVLHTYFERYFRTSLAEGAPSPTFIVRSAACADRDTGGYAEVPLGTIEFHLFSRLPAG